VISAKANITIALKILRDADAQINTAALAACGAMADKALRLCKQMVSQIGDDHSLKDLAALGHPYARRDPQPIHDPMEQIHARAGDIVRGLIATRPVASHGVISASVYNSAQPLDTMLQAGTSKMIARPYMSYVEKTWGRDIAEAGRRAFEELSPASGTKVSGRRT